MSTTDSIVDYTKWRRGIRTGGGTIQICPQCGRKGERHVYQNRAQAYFHKGERSAIGLHITDRCLIPAPAESEGR